jgi:hypothetical protein
MLCQTASAGLGGSAGPAPLVATLQSRNDSACESFYFPPPFRWEIVWSPPLLSAAIRALVSSASLRTARACAQHDGYNGLGLKQNQDQC